MNLPFLRRKAEPFPDLERDCARAVIESLSQVTPSNLAEMLVGESVAQLHARLSSVDDAILSADGRMMHLECDMAEERRCIGGLKDERTELLRRIKALESVSFDPSPKTDKRKKVREVA